MKKYHGTANIERPRCGVLREGVRFNRLNSPLVVVPLLAKHSLVIHKFNVASPNDPTDPPTIPASLSPAPSP